MQVAASNPKARSRKARSAAEISTPTASNRYVVYPYTKLMNAFPSVDQSAAVVLTTVGQARSLGRPASLHARRSPPRSPLILGKHAAAAILALTSCRIACAGIPEDRWVYPMGGANFVDVDVVVERLRLDESPAVRQCVALGAWAVGDGGRGSAPCAPRLCD